MIYLRYERNCGKIKWSQLTYFNSAAYTGQLIWRRMEGKSVKRLATMNTRHMWLHRFMPWAVRNMAQQKDCTLHDFHWMY